MEYKTTLCVNCILLTSITYCNNTNSSHNDMIHSKQKKELKNEHVFLYNYSCNSNPKI